jgi:hypothetical protein
MSDTPRTDAALVKIECDDSCAMIFAINNSKEYDGEIARADEMARIELELRTVRAECEKLRQVRNRSGVAQHAAVMDERERCLKAIETLAEEWRDKTDAFSTDAEQHRLQGVVLFEFEIIKRIKAPQGGEVEDGKRCPHCQSLERKINDDGSVYMDHAYNCPRNKRNFECKITATVNTPQGGEAE